MKILIMRNMATVVNVGKYNLQEIGLAKALTSMGHECTIVYYSKNKERQVEYFDVGEGKIKVVFEYGLNIANMAVYYRLFNEKFFDQFDIIQSSEYRELMTVVLPLFTKAKIVMSNGLYQDNRFSTLNKLFDCLFLRTLRKKYNEIIVKSDLARDYLVSKGFNCQQIHVCGVGLDESTLDTRVTKNMKLSELKSKKEELVGCKILGYLGVLEDRRNIQLLFSVLADLLLKDDSFRLVLIGNGNSSDVEKYFKYAERLGVLKNIIYMDGIDQNEVSEFYELIDLFVLPSSYEIFGMVLLESLYFGVPVVTSWNGGSSVLVENGVNGYICREFSVDMWSATIYQIFTKGNLQQMQKNISCCDILWRDVAKKYEKVYRDALIS